MAPVLLRPNRKATDEPSVPAGTDQQEASAARNSAQLLTAGEGDTGCAQGEHGVTTRSVGRSAPANQLSTDLHFVFFVPILSILGFRLRPDKTKKPRVADAGGAEALCELRASSG